MALSGASQSLAMALGAVLGGLLISRDANGMVVGYWQAAVVGIGLAALSLWVLKRVHMHIQNPGSKAL